MLNIEGSRSNWNARRVFSIHWKLIRRFITQSVDLKFLGFLKELGSSDESVASIIPRVTGSLSTQPIPSLPIVPSLRSGEPIWYASGLTFYHSLRHHIRRASMALAVDAENPSKPGTSTIAGRVMLRIWSVWDPANRVVVTTVTGVEAHLPFGQWKRVFLGHLSSNLVEQNKKNLCSQPNRGGGSHSYCLWLIAETDFAIVIHICVNCFYLNIINGVIVCTLPLRISLA